MDKIVVLDGFVANPGDLSWDGLSRLGDLHVYDRTSPEYIVPRCRGAVAVFTNKVRIDDAVMSRLPGLRFIGVLATGYDNVDVSAARQRDIVVCNVPAYSTDSVVQLVFAHLLNIVDGVAAHSDSVKRGDWRNCPDFSYRISPMIELSGLTMGIYGLGNIGGRVAKIADAFGMRVIAYTSKDQAQLPDYVVKVGKEDLFRRSDVLSLNAPLTESNHNFVNDTTLSLMKPDAIIINTARGGLVDAAALSRALRERKIYAAGIDVLSQEPPVDGDPLLEEPHCHVTPHIAWQSNVARRSLLSISADNLAAFIAGKPQNVVN